MVLHQLGMSCLVDFMEGLSLSEQRWRRTGLGRGAERRRGMEWEEEEGEAAIGI